jgi:hypothetical protein
MAELRNHVVACRSCSDFVLIRQTLQTARQETALLPRLERPGVLWWRAQLRRRNEAIERIEQPILGAQLFAFGVVLAVGAMALVWQFGRGSGLSMALWAAWLKDLRGAFHFESLLPVSWAVSDGGLWILVPILAAVALLSGVVVCLAASERQ